MVDPEMSVCDQALTYRSILPHINGERGAAAEIAKTTQEMKNLCVF